MTQMIYHTRGIIVKKSVHVGLLSALAGQSRRDDPADIARPLTVTPREIF
jgi:hypothetical protein